MQNSSSLRSTGSRHQTAGGIPWKCGRCTSSARTATTHVARHAHVALQSCSVARSLSRTVTGPPRRFPNNLLAGAVTDTIGCRANLDPRCKSFVRTVRPLSTCYKCNQFGRRRSASGSSSSSTCSMKTPGIVRFGSVSHRLLPAAAQHKASITSSSGDASHLNACDRTLD